MYYSYILTCSVDFFFFSFDSLSGVVVNFTGFMKSNEAFQLIIFSLPPPPALL